MSSKKPAKKKSVKKAPKAKGAAKKSAKKATAKSGAKPAKVARSAKKAAGKKAAGKAVKKKASKASKAAAKPAAKKAAAKTQARKRAAKKATHAAKKATKKKLGKGLSTEAISVETKKQAPPKAAKKPTATVTHKKPLSPKSPSKTIPAKAAASKPAAARTPAKPKKSRPRKPGELPPINELEELPTEDLWGIYRDAVQNPKDNAVYIQDLRNLLIERHYPLVRYIAERLLQTLPKSIELDDLISAGLFGLMDAIRGFDADRGIKFKTYCSTRIRGSILDQLRSQDWVPRLVRLKAGKIERALQKLTGEYGREPTHAELARNLEMQHDDLVKEIQDSRAKTMFSLSEKWEDDDGSVEKVEILEDKGAIDPVSELNRRDLMGYITRSLTHKERFIIEQYYQYGHTMREIGEMLSLTESRVCQIHSNVMGRLKGLLGVREDSLLP